MIRWLPYSVTRSEAESERTLAASALAEYVSDQPDELAELLMDATERQFAALYPSVERRSDQTAPLLEVELSQEAALQERGTTHRRG